MPAHTYRYTTIAEKAGERLFPSYRSHSHSHHRLHLIQALTSRFLTLPSSCHTSNLLPSLCLPYSYSYSFLSQSLHLLLSCPSIPGAVLPFQFSSEHEFNTCQDFPISFTLFSLSPDYRDISLSRALSPSSFLSV